MKLGKRQKQRIDKTKHKNRIENKLYSISSVIRLIKTETRYHHSILRWTEFILASTTLAQM